MTAGVVPAQECSEGEQAIGRDASSEGDVALAEVERGD